MEKVQIIVATGDYDATVVLNLSGMRLPAGGLIPVCVEYNQQKSVGYARVHVKEDKVIAEINEELAITYGLFYPGISLDSFSFREAVGEPSIIEKSELRMVGLSAMYQGFEKVPMIADQLQEQETDELRKATFAEGAAAVREAKKESFTFVQAKASHTAMMKMQEEMAETKAQLITARELMEKAALQWYCEYEAKNPRHAISETAWDVKMLIAYQKYLLEMMASASVPLNVSQLGPDWNSKEARFDTSNIKPYVAGRYMGDGEFEAIRVPAERGGAGSEKLISSYQTWMGEVRNYSIISGRPEPEEDSVKLLWIDAHARGKTPQEAYDAIMGNRTVLGGPNQ